MTDPITPPPELLGQWIQEWISIHGPDKEGIDYVVVQAARWGAERERARAALAQPEPVTPTDEEIMELFWEHQNGLEELWADDWPAAARAVLAKWGHQ
jgi:hypothetical protein